jgi:hypothetical protein
MTALPPPDTPTGTLCWLCRQPAKGRITWVALVWIKRRGGPKGGIFEGWNLPLLPGTFNPEILTDCGWRYHSRAIPPSVI